MLRILALLVLAAAVAFPAQAQQIDSVTFYKPGIYKAGSETKSIDDKSISTGQRTTTEKISVVQVTTTIPAGPDTFVGVEGIITGPSPGSNVTVRVVWRYPPPGLRNPATGIAKLTDEYDDVRVVGTPFVYYWYMNADWQYVPGTWTLELWQGNRKLASQDFLLTR